MEDEEVEIAGSARRWERGTRTRRKGWARRMRRRASTEDYSGHSKHIDLHEEGKTVPRPSLMDACMHWGMCCV